MVSREFILNSKEVTAEDEQNNEKLIAELIDYVEKNETHSADVALAYGYSIDGESDECPSHLKPLVALMASIYKRGLPMQHIYDVVQLRRAYESAPRKYEMIVDSLRINDNEKHMLKSIVSDRRDGTLQFFRGQECVLDYEIKEWPKGTSEEYIASTLLLELKTILMHGDIEYDVFLSI